MSNQGTLKKGSGEMEDIDKEAQKLLKRNLDNKKSSEILLAELRSKYKDEEVVENNELGNARKKSEETSLSEILENV
jgi:hypothetical protein